MPKQGSITRVTLCSSCVDVSDCVNRYMRGYDVLFCDMFRDSGKTSIEEVNTRTASLSGPEKKTDTKKSSELKGLCEICIHRKTCALPRPKSGVWHCEEFE